MIYQNANKGIQVGHVGIHEWNTPEYRKISQHFQQYLYCESLWSVVISVRSVAERMNTYKTVLLTPNHT